MPRVKEPYVFLFDLYSTLLDVRTDEGDPEVWHQLTKHLGIESHAWEFRARFEHHQAVELSTSSESYPEVHLDRCFTSALSEFGLSCSPDRVTDAMRQYRELCMRRYRVFPDAIPALTALRARYRLGLVSDAQRVFFDDELARSGLATMFDTVICSSDYPFHKPDPRMFTLALTQLEVPPDRAVYVGDSLDRDVRGARGAGLVGILLDRGNVFGGGAGDSPPDYVIGSLSDLTYRYLT